MPARCVSNRAPISSRLVAKWRHCMDLQCYPFYVAVVSRFLIHSDDRPTIRFQIWIPKRRAGTDAQVAARTICRSPRNNRIIPHIVLRYFFLHAGPLQPPSLLHFVGLSARVPHRRDSKVSPRYRHQFCSKRNSTTHTGIFTIKLYVSFLPITWLGE